MQVEEVIFESSLDISLHPLVIINISDHDTRERVKNSKHTKIVGAILGTQSGKRIEITNSFELLYDTIEDHIIIDSDFFLKKREQFETVFPGCEFLGWYSNSQLQEDLSIHKQIMAFNENPIYLLLESLTVSSAKELPIKIFDSEIRIVDNEPILRFTSKPYKIETHEAERIGVDHVAHSLGHSAVEGSATISHLQGMHNAVRMLNIRISFVLQYLEKVKRGELPKDHHILRQLKSVTSLLPTIDTPDYSEYLVNEYNDSLLIAFLSSITKCSSISNDVAAGIQEASQYKKMTMRERRLR